MTVPKPMDPKEDDKAPELIALEADVAACCTVGSLLLVVEGVTTAVTTVDPL